MERGREGGPVAGRGFRGTAENAKTKLCTRWLQGDCRFGERCNFAHGEGELRAGSGPAGGPPSGQGYGRGGGRGGPYPAGPFPGRGSPAGGRGFGRGYNGGGGYNQGQQGGYGFEHHHGGGAYGGAGGFNPPPAPPPQDSNYWAAQNFPVEGPNGWTEYRSPENGDPYYHNNRTGTTTWEKPADWTA